MNMNMKSIFSNIILIACLMTCGSIAVNAQQKTLSTQEMREKALSTIRVDYEMNATLNGQEAQYAFLTLFVDENAPVYNDLLGQQSDNMLTAAKYVSVLGGAGLRTKRVAIKNLRVIEEPQKVNGVWKVKVAFDKELSYYDRCGVFFSSREFFQDDYHLVATMVYDNIDGRCRIERIDGSSGNRRRLPSEYFVFKQTDERDALLNYHDQPLSFNSNKQAFLMGTYDSNGFTHPKYSPNKLQPFTNDCNMVMMKYGTSGGGSPIEFDGQICLRLNMGMGLGDALSITGGDGLTDQKTSGMNFGIDVGYQFLSTDAYKLSAYVGLGIATSKIEAGYKKSDYKYETQGEADIDGDSYERHYDNLKINQKVSLTDLAIPIYLDAEFCLGPIVSVYADLGARLNFNMSKSLDMGEVSATDIYGIYRKYNNMRFDSEWGSNGFKKGDPVMISTNKMDTELEGLNSMTADLMGGLGVRFNIPNSPVAIDLGASYMMGLGEIIKNDAVVRNPSFITYTLEGGEQVQSLTDTMESVKKQSLRLNIGLIYKF